MTDGRAEQGVNRLPIHLWPALGLLERGVHDAVALLRSRAVRPRLHEIADDRVHAAQRHAFRFLRIAHERGHGVPTPQQSITHRRPNVPGRSCQEDAHREAHIVVGLAPAPSTNTERTNR
ncbi:MAG: hypothetical protein A3I61_09605 [Acidobacteria bacterium RIFCSPLOWO2_02_FULL_68_18]|nr:MAG: hypothetical protein A3I61_09605 [Acidobacteria bacterium RIFCSPLOWO2_02_FULL_68_18]